MDFHIFVKVIHAFISILGIDDLCLASRLASLHHRKVILSNQLNDLSKLVIDFKLKPSKSYL